jgi:hypothetical protein
MKFGTFDSFYPFIEKFTNLKSLFYDEIRNRHMDDEDYEFNYDLT